MIRKQDIWARPELNESTNDSKEVSIWKQMVWDALPETPKEAKWDEKFNDIISKIAKDVNAVESKNQIFDFTDYLIDRGILGYASWRLYGVTSDGKELNFDLSNDIFHIPGTKNDIEKDVNTFKIGMTKAERRMSDYSFVAADDKNLRIYTIEDENQKKKSIFEFNSPAGYQIYVDPDSIYDDKAKKKTKTFIFYQNTLTECSEYDLEAAKRYTRMDIEGNGFAGIDHKRWFNEAYLKCVNGSIIPEQDLTQSRLKREFGFGGIEGLKRFWDDNEKRKAIVVTNVTYSQLASILDLDDRDMSGDGSWAVDISEVKPTEITERWFLNYLDSLNKSEYQAVTKELVKAIEYMPDGSVTDCYKELSKQKTWKEKYADYRKYGSLERQMMARAFADYVSMKAETEHIDNDLLKSEKSNLLKVMRSDRGFNQQVTKAIDNMIEAGIQNGKLHRRHVGEINVVTAQAGIEKHEKNIFMSPKSNADANNTFSTVDQAHGQRM